MKAFEINGQTVFPAYRLIGGKVRTPNNDCCFLFSVGTAKIEKLEVSYVMEGERCTVVENGTK